MADNPSYEIFSKRLACCYAGMINSVLSFQTLCLLVVRFCSIIVFWTYLQEEKEVRAECLNARLQDQLFTVYCVLCAIGWKGTEIRKGNIKGKCVSHSLVNPPRHWPSYRAFYQVSKQPSCLICFLKQAGMKNGICPEAWKHQNINLISNLTSDEQKSNVLSQLKVYFCVNPSLFLIQIAITKRYSKVLLR